MSPEEWTRQEMTQNGVLLDHPGSTTPQLVVLHRPCIPENVRHGLNVAMSYINFNRYLTAFWTTKRKPLRPDFNFINVEIKCVR